MYPEGCLKQNSYHLIMTPSPPPSRHSLKFSSPSCCYYLPYSSFVGHCVAGAVPWQPENAETWICARVSFRGISSGFSSKPCFVRSSDVSSPKKPPSINLSP